MKTGCLTINQLIGLLEKAKRELGGSHRVRVYDRDGEVILPKSMNHGCTSRGNIRFDWVDFSEDAQP